MGDGVKARHAGKQVTDGAGEGYPKINPGNGTGNLSRTGQYFLGIVGGFDPEKLHPADIQKGQNGNRHDNNTDAAEPLQ